MASLSRILRSHSPLRRRVDKNQADKPSSPKKLLKSFTRKMWPFTSVTQPGTGYQAEDAEPLAVYGGVGALVDVQDARESDAPLFDVDAFNAFCDDLYRLDKVDNYGNHLSSSAQAALTASFASPFEDLQLIPYQSVPDLPGVYDDNFNFEDEFNFLPDDYKNQRSQGSLNRINKDQSYELKLPLHEGEDAHFTSRYENNDIGHSERIAPLAGSSGATSPSGSSHSGSPAPECSLAGFAAVEYSPEDLDRFLAGEFGEDYDASGRSDLVYKLGLSGDLSDYLGGPELNANEPSGSGTTLGGPALFDGGNFGHVANDIDDALSRTTFPGISPAFRTDLTDDGFPSYFPEFDADIVHLLGHSTADLYLNQNWIPIPDGDEFFDPNLPPEQPKQPMEAGLDEDGPFSISNIYNEVSANDVESTSAIKSEKVTTTSFKSLRKPGRPKGKGKGKNVVEQVPTSTPEGTTPTVTPSTSASSSGSDYFSMQTGTKSPPKSRRRKIGTPDEEKAPCLIPGCTEWVTRTDAPSHITQKHSDLYPKNTVMWCPLMPCRAKGPFLSDSFSRHYRDVHHGIRPKCPLCGKALGRSERYYLERHQESKACRPLGTEVVKRKMTDDSDEDDEGPTTKKLKTDDLN